MVDRYRQRGQRLDELAALIRSNMSGDGSWVRGIPNPPNRRRAAERRAQRLAHYDG
jgi:hypothetical protein